MIGCHLSKINDGICHDECSVPWYRYDGYDCCNVHIDDSVCKSCICPLNLERHPSIREFGCLNDHLGKMTLSTDVHSIAIFIKIHLQP